MAALPSDPPQFLTLSEQLDAMLLGWLERHAMSLPADARAAAVITIAAAHLPEVEAFCAGWGISVKRVAENLIRVDGPRLPVVGFAEITAMYRA